MIITFKTLQQQTFKLEIDDTATVGTKLTNLKSLSICNCILYGSELRHDLLTIKFSIVLPRNIDFLSYRVTFLYVCVKLCEDFSLKMSFRRHAFKNLLQPKNHLNHSVLQSTFNVPDSTTINPCLKIVIFYRTSPELPTFLVKLERPLLVSWSY